MCPNAYRCVKLIVLSSAHLIYAIHALLRIAVHVVQALDVDIAHHAVVADPVDLANVLRTKPKIN